MELRHLRYFIRVAEELHFGRAAARLGISQPPLSQQIQALEEELGIALFVRTSRRVALTEAGRLFLVEARKTVEQAARAVDVARRARQGEMGELAIGFATSAPFTTVVAQALFAFRKSYPSIHLTLSELPRGAQVQAIADDRLDLGFIRGVDLPALPPTIEARMLMREPLLVAMRVDHPLARTDQAVRIRELRDEPFVFYQREYGAGFNEHIAMLCRNHGFEPAVVQEASGLATLLGLVAAGFGLTVLTRSLSRLHPENVVFRPLDDIAATSMLWLIHRVPLSTASRQFIDLVEAMPEIFPETTAA